MQPRRSARPSDYRPERHGSVIAGIARATGAWLHSRHHPRRRNGVRHAKNQAFFKPLGTITEKTLRRWSAPAPNGFVASYVFGLPR
jgi:hypothetical protein